MPPYPIAGGVDDLDEDTPPIIPQFTSEEASRGILILFKCVCVYVNECRNCISLVLYHSFLSSHVDPALADAQQQLVSFPPEPAELPSVLADVSRPRPAVHGQLVPLLSPRGRRRTYHVQLG